MRVLIAGASGFIGQTVLRFMPTGWEVVALGRSRFAGTPSCEAVHVERFDADLPESLTKPFDVVLYVAGNSNHGLAAREPWADLMATGVASAALLGRIEASRVVLLSSAAVYAGSEGLVDPGACLDPLMPYALSKRYCEGLVRSLSMGGRFDSWIVLRLYNAFGPGERPTRLVPSALAAARSGSHFKLSGNPMSLSDPLHVDDVARVLVAAAAHRGSGVLDLCGGDPQPLREQITRIFAAVGMMPPTVVADPDPLEVPIRFWSDPSPVLQMSGMNCFEPFPAAVYRYVTEGHL